jgi:hypothetical protein
VKTGSWEAKLSILYEAKTTVHKQIQSVYVVLKFHRKVLKGIGNVKRLSGR